MHQRWFMWFVGYNPSSARKIEKLKLHSSHLLSEIDRTLELGSIHRHLIQLKSETSDISGWIQLLHMRVVWSESDRQFQEILNSEGISGKSVSDWRENCKCGGKLSTHFSLIRIKKQMFASLTFHIEMLKNWKSSIAHFDFHRFSNFFFLLAASHLQFSFLCFRRRWFPIAALSVFPPAHNHEITKASNLKRFLSSLHIGVHCTEIKMEN